MYDSQVFRRAVSLLERDVQHHRKQQQNTRMRVYEKTPRIEEIDRQMQRLSLQVCKNALRRVSSHPLDEQMAALRLERAALLEQNGWDPFVLDDEPLCRICGDSGWVEDGMCVCLKRRCVGEQMKQLSNTMRLGNQSFETFSLDVYSAAKEPSLNISPREAMSKNLETCKQFAHFFGKTPYKNLLFSGKPGLGKTFLSACIARVVSEHEHSVVYDTAINILRCFEQEKFRGDEDARDETRRYMGCDLLIIDDLGCEMNSPFVMSALYELINSRLVENRATIISTNLKPNDIKQRYSAQISSRLLGEYKLIGFLGDDLRQHPSIK